MRQRRDAFGRFVDTGRGPWCKTKEGRRFHRLRQRVLANRTEYHLSWEQVESRKGVGGVAWESPIGGRIVRVAQRSYAWFRPDGGVVFDVPTRRECIEMGKEYATPEQLRVIDIRSSAV